MQSEMIDSNPNANYGCPVKITSKQFSQQIRYASSSWPNHSYVFSRKKPPADVDGIIKSYWRCSECTRLREKCNVPGAAATLHVRHDGDMETIVTDPEMGHHEQCYPLADASINARQLCQAAKLSLSSQPDKRPLEVYKNACQEIDKQFQNCDFKEAVANEMPSYKKIRRTLYRHAAARRKTQGQRNMTLNSDKPNAESSADESGEVVGLKIMPPLELMKPLSIPIKFLMGAGPSNSYARIREAGSLPLLGHLHPEFLQVMSEVKAGIQYLFQTSNKYTFCVSGSGHLAMEASLCNILERGETVAIVVNGIWGVRATDMAERCGAIVQQIVAKPGGHASIKSIEDTLKKQKPKALFVCHGESSTGVRHPLEGLKKLCEKYETLLIVDTVASLGGTPVHMDILGIDVLYSGSQKVLSAPPGISPISFSDKAIEKIKGRQTKVQSWYVDALLLGNYWGCDEGPIKYHHTGPITLVYAMREALAILAEETLENCWKRHQDAAKQLYSGLTELGLKFLVRCEADRLPTITTILVPEHIDDQKLSEICMKKYSIEIARTLFPQAGKVWRVGLMGNNCNPKNVELVLRAFKEVLNQPAVLNSSL